MNRNLLATAICASLLAAGAAHAQTSQNTSQDQSTNAQQTSQGSTPATPEKKKKPETLKAIVVTGSLIPQSQIETANPVIKISSQQLERRGFGTVYDALRHLTIATGSVQDNQFTGGFTPGAQTISLLGLDPGFTLYLINGHPMSDYPLLYNGQSNFVDLSDIPVGMVDHIEILPGNQSAIYGSSAIAGVINIILKDHISGYELNVRGGGYSGGGGSNERLEFLGGHTWGKLDATFGVQLSNQKPIWGYQRRLTRSTTISPDPNTNVASRTFLLLNGNTGDYIDPGSAACTPLSNLYGGTVSYQYRPNHGYYCGTKYDVGYSTILNRVKAGTAYVNLKYQLNDNTQLYANVLYNVSSIRFSGGPYDWSGVTPNGYFFDPNYQGGTYLLAQHIYSPEEIGSWKLDSTKDLERSYNAWAGVRGTIGDSDWNYDIFYARSQQKLAQKQWWPLKDASTAFFENQFMGPQQGYTSGGTYPIFTPNLANFYKALTPAQYATFNGVIASKNETYTQNINFQLTNTDLFDLPAGAVGFAGLFQYGGQSWQNPNDPRIIAGDFYGLTGTSGGGKRNNWAYAAEFRIPIFKMLTADVSARYDQYSNTDGGTTDGRVSYKAALEFRPIDTLLFRAHYGTAFRAPDMAYTFGGKSGAYQPGLTDYYLCAKNYPPNTPLQDCKKYYANQDPFLLHTGNLNLKSVTAKSWGVGVVWSPTHDFNIKADYYNIRIANEVQLQDVDQMLKDEANCRLGKLPPDSPTCINTLAAITRGPDSGPLPLNLQEIHITPINVANENVSGVLASLDYTYDIGRYGSLAFNAQYNVTLKHTFQQYPYDPIHDLLRNPYYSSEFKNVASASVTWDIGKFETTLYGIRYGKTANYYAGQGPSGYATPCTTDSAGYTQCPGTVAPWMVYNASVSYNITPDMQIRGIVNNIKNSMPPNDYSNNSSPYYNNGNYNVYGRQFWLEFDWKFGQGK